MTHMFPVCPDQVAPFVVYGYFRAGVCIYVGQTKDLAQRFNTQFYGLQPYAYLSDEVRILATATTRQKSRLLERDFIRTLDPEYNIQHSPTNGVHFTAKKPARRRKQAA